MSFIAQCLTKLIQSDSLFACRVIESCIIYTERLISLLVLNPFEELILHAYVRHEVNICMDL